jgi:rubrerythrin
LNDIYSEYGHFLATENADLSDKEKLSTIKEKMLYQIDDEEENITHKYDLITEMEKQAEQNNVPSYVIEDEIRALNNSASMSKNVIGSYERVIKEIDEILGTL